MDCNVKRALKIAIGVFLIGTAAGVVTWQTLRRGEATAADHLDATLVAHGQAVYAQNCAVCHGAKLEGQPNWQRIKPDDKLPAPPHDPSGHTWHHSDNRLFLIIKDGLATEYETDMPVFGDVLSDHDIWAVLSYIKSTWPEDIRKRQPVFRATPAP